MSSIDERALESLSFISTLSNQLSGFNSRTDSLSKYFPTFVWLIRDFALDLTTKSNTEVFFPLNFKENTVNKSDFTERIYGKCIKSCPVKRGRCLCEE